MQQLRVLWKDLNAWVQGAISYTYRVSGDPESFGEVLRQLSCVIDDVRAVFCNVGEKPGQRGLYPFEPIKEIRAAVAALGSGPSFDPAQARDTRAYVVAKWKSLQTQFLREFDRDYPTFTHSPFIRDKTLRHKESATNSRAAEQGVAPDGRRV